MRFGVRGVAVLQVWLMVFGFIGIVFMMGGALGVSENVYDHMRETDPAAFAPAEAAAPTTSALAVPSSGESLREALDKINAADESASSTIAGAKAVAEGNAAGVAGVDKANTGWTGAMGTHPDSYASGFFKLTPGSGASALASGVQWAALAYFAGTMLGDMFGFSEDNSKALGTSLAAGAAVYKGLSTWSTTAGGTGFMSPGFIGLGVGVVVFALMYKDVETKVVTFSCMPWQAPNGGNDCEVCNDDDLGCSEYRCKSLGQSCEIVNEGTVEEKCVYVNPQDVNPPVIKPNYDELSSGHDYKNVKNSPPGPGFDIVYVGAKDGCLKAFTPLEFGLMTDEPAQCKIDFNHTTSFDEMVAYVGGSNLYSYNHSEMFSLPGASELSGSGFALENGKDLTFYVRCMDKNGNQNEAEYAVNFCVDPSPDTTAPKIEATSIVNEGCVAEDVDKAEVVFYVNEPSNCKWSFQDQDYDLMENDMSCAANYNQANAAQLFACNSVLTGIPRDGSDYYIRCKDKAKTPNEMRQSFEFSLRGSTGLVLKNMKPNATVFGGVSPAPIELYAETYFGCNEGLAVCEWSNDGNNYIQFFDTNNEDGIHTQRLDLVDGNHKYYVRCTDEGGNVVTDVAEFEVEIDTNAPMVARVYEEGGMLKIVTVRDSECSYSLDDCDFSFLEGVEMPYGNSTTHVAEWSEENTYFIKCRDEFLNEGADCSIVVRPSTNFL